MLGNHFKATQNLDNLVSGLHYETKQINAEAINLKTSYHGKIKLTQTKHLIIIGSQDTIFHGFKDYYFDAHDAFCKFGDFILSNPFYQTLEVGCLANSDEEAKAKIYLLLTKGKSSFSFKIQRPNSLAEFAKFAANERSKQKDKWD